MASPDVNIDFDELTNDYGKVIDWIGATVTIDFPQWDGSVRTYTYSIPGSVVSEAIEKESIDPISSHLADIISGRWQDATGQGYSATSKQYDTAKLYIENQLESQILSDITGIKERQAEAATCSPAVIDRYTRARDKIEKSNAEIERLEGEQSEWRSELDILESQEETPDTIEKIKTA